MEVVPAALAAPAAVAIAASLPHHDVGDLEELHDLLVEVEVLEALEEVRVLLTVAALQAHLLRLRLGQQDAQVVLESLNGMKGLLISS